MNRTELLPCPICGGCEVFVVFRKKPSVNRKSRHVKCECGCKLKGDFFTDEEAIVAWNNRPGKENNHGKD